jgi:hypothetical protein
MSPADRTTIGFDRRVDIEWLDAAAGRVAAGHSTSEIREFLWALLQGAVAGDTASSARGKTLTVLMRIWVTVPPAAMGIRSDAVRLLPSATADERRAIHWAMSVACYPFFAEVAANAGKLLALNGQITISQINGAVGSSRGDSRQEHVRAAGPPHPDF